jgi:hypothetical protein
MKLLLGYCFVSYLRSLVRSDDEFDGFLKAYVQKYAYKSVVSSDFLSTFLEHFPHLKGIENKYLPFMVVIVLFKLSSLT